MADTEDIKEEESQEPAAPRYNLGSVEEYLAAAEDAAKKDGCDEAISILREATAKYPDSAAANYDLGVAIFMKLKAELAHLEIWEDLAGQEELAEECFSAFHSAIEADPQMTAAYNNLGVLLTLRRRTRKALEVLEKSLKINPDQPEVRKDAEDLRRQIAEEEE